MYDTSCMEISYSSDREYRATFRSIFGMVSSNNNTLSPTDTMNDSDDDITEDENDYDVGAATHVMDEIYEKIQHDGLFRELLDHAAGKMLSFDPSIGLTILFSYDYFAAFHRCLCVFLAPMGVLLWNREHPAFVAMLEKIK